MNAKRLGFKAFDIHFGTFDFSVHIIIGPLTNVEKYVRWKMKDPDFNLSAINPLGLHFTRHGWVPILWLPRRPRTAREHGTLAHEALHCVRSLMVDWVGMNLNCDTDEAFCHALGHLVTSILDRTK